MGIEFDGEEILREEKPVRIVIPDEMGVYWVKMVNRIDLYESISPKDIENVHIFSTLIKDIKPYYYEYYGSKDEAYLVGRILNKFSNVDPNGFFTMVGSDGLVKNETISMVRDRYYIKVGGENAPMNISPAFKLGMNVKGMSHFSTTKDAVIFPEIMMQVLGENETSQGKGMKLRVALEAAGMVFDGDESFVIVDLNGEEHSFSIGEIEDGYLVSTSSGANAIVGDKILEDIQRISKMQ